MDLAKKLIIPLLDERITKEDISKEAGFINAFTDDINRPWLQERYIFLLYSLAKGTKESFNRYYKFKELDCLHSKCYITINGHSFILYTFIVINLNAKKILQRGSLNLTSKDIIQVVKFWNFTDDEVNDYMINNEHKIYSPIHNSTVPETDDRMNDIPFYRKKGLCA